jgi:hypothetical protein
VIVEIVRREQHRYPGRVVDVDVMRQAGAMSGRAFVLVLVLALMVTATSAVAVRPPDRGEAQALRSATRTWLRAHLEPALVKKTRIVGLSVSSANHQYAKVVVLVERIGYNGLLLRATSRGWKVLDFGSDAPGCDLAPRPVTTDLFGGCVPS